MHITFVRLIISGDGLVNIWNAISWTTENCLRRKKATCVISVSLERRNLTVSGDFSVSLHTYILIPYNIFVFFVSIYIKSLRSNARPGRGKSALVCTHIGLGPTNSRQKCTLKDVTYADMKWYIWLTDLIYKHRKGHWNRRSLYNEVVGWFIILTASSALIAWQSILQCSGMHTISNLFLRFESWITSFLMC